MWTEVLIALFGVLAVVVGALVGWVLNGVSKFNDGRKEDKKLLNRIIAELLFLKYEVNQQEGFIKGSIVLHGYSWEAEKERQRMIEKNLGYLEVLDSDYGELFDRIASYDPILGEETMHQIILYRQLKEKKMSEISKIPSVYEKILTEMEMTMRLTSCNIEKAILKLSFESSKSLGRRMKKKLKKSSEVNERLLGEWGGKTKNQKKTIDKALGMVGDVRAIKDKITDYREVGDRLEVDVDGDTIELSSELVKRLGGEINEVTIASVIISCKEKELLDKMNNIGKIRDKITGYREVGDKLEVDIDGKTIELPVDYIKDIGVDIDEETIAGVISFGCEELGLEELYESLTK